MSEGEAALSGPHAYVEQNRVFAFVIWLCMGLCLLCVGGGVAGASSPIAVYVHPASGGDARAAAWVEGHWFDLLKQRIRSTEKVFGAVPAPKQEALQKAAKAFQAGQVSYNNLEFGKALRFFRKSVRLYESAVPYLFDLKPLAKAWLLIGTVELVNGKKASARRAYQQAVLFDPKASLKGIEQDKSRFQFFARSKAALASKSRGLLEVTSSEPGALYINGQFLGVTPQKVSLPPGTHMVVVRKPGVAWWGKMIALSGTSFSVNADLQARPGRVSWMAAGVAAAAHVGKVASFPESVSVFALKAGAQQVLVARVKRVKGGTHLSVSAAVYDRATKRQVAAGGALVPWQPTTGQRVVSTRLLEDLLSGKSVAIGGWKPTSMKLPRPVPPKGKGGGAGGWIALGVTLGVLAIGGGTFAVLYFTQPQLFRTCPSSGGCIQLTIQ